MMTSQIDIFEKQIREKLPTHESPATAAEAIKREASVFGITFSADMDKNLATALARVVASLGSVEVLRHSSLIKSREE
ncbi:hypothetical protein D3C76_734100 [compost metagenome]